jgi:hypothetical protein
MGAQALVNLGGAAASRCPDRLIFCHLYLRCETLWPDAWALSQISESGAHVSRGLHAKKVYLGWCILPQVHPARARHGTFGAKA